MDNYVLLHDLGNFAVTPSIYSFTYSGTAMMSCEILRCLFILLLCAIFLQSVADHICPLLTVLCRLYPCSVYFFHKLVRKGTCRFSLSLLHSVWLVSVWFSKLSFLIICICIFLILLNVLLVFIFSLLTCPVHSRHPSARCLNSCSSSRFDCYQRWRATSDTCFLPIIFICHVSSERWWSMSSTASFFSLLSMNSAWEN